MSCPWPRLEAVRYWLDDEPSGRSTGTVANYKCLAEKRILPALGARKLRELSAEDVAGGSSTSRRHRARGPCACCIRFSTARSSSSSQLQLTSPVARRDTPGQQAAEATNTRAASEPTSGDALKTRSGDEDSLVTRPNRTANPCPCKCDLESASRPKNQPPRSAGHSPGRRRRHDHGDGGRRASVGPARRRRHVPER
jgi:hypothetical protein